MSEPDQPLAVLSSEGLGRLAHQHCAPDDVAALVRYLEALADPAKETMPSHENTDWRTLAGTCARVIMYLSARTVSLEYDASVGQRWRETSRLEDWFPFTAEELARLRAALLACARMAEALKRECGPDPEGQQAVRNAEYQRISTAAHVALGTIRGAQLLMPRESIAMLWNSLPIDLEAEAIVSFVRGVERYHGLTA